MATGAPNGANKRTKSYSVNCGKEDDLRQIVNILVAAAQRNPVTQLRPTPASHMASKPSCMKPYFSSQSIIFLQSEFRVYLCNRTVLSKYSFIMFNYFLCSKQLKNQQFLRYSNLRQNIFGDFEMLQFCKEIHTMLVLVLLATFQPFFKWLGQ